MSTVAALVADVRLQCDVVDDAQVEDATIVGYLNDAAQALYDIFREAGFTHWFITSSSFTLSGNGVGQNTSTLPADFMADKGLDWNNPPNGNRPWTVPRLGTFQDRNRGNFLGAPVGPSGAVFSREYMCEGELVTVVPYFQSEGQYTLWYTKQLEALAEPIVLSPLPYSRAPAHNVADGSTAGSQLIVTNGAFTSRDVGATIVISGSANALDGTYTVATVVDATHVTTSPAMTPGLVAGSLTVITITDLSVTAATGVWTFNGDLSEVTAGDSLIVSGSASNDGTYTILTVSTSTQTITTAIAGLVNETFGSDVSVTVQPAGTIATIPQRLVPWQLYLKTFASISVKVSRQEDTSALQLRLDQEKRRAQLAAEERSAETIKQIQPAGGSDAWGSSGWGPFGWGDW